MKQNLHSFLILTIALASLAVISNAAYTNPTTSAPGNNNELVPITIGTVPQVKNGGLSVQAFNATGNVEIQGMTTIQGLVRGGTPAEQNSTVQFGFIGQQVSIAATGQVSAQSLQSSVLAPGGAVCADLTGRLIICP